MFAERAMSNGEFYKPLTVVEETRRKLQGLLRQPPATLSDTQLFESIADTRATIATQLVNVGSMGVYGPVILEGLVSLDFETTKGITGIGYRHENGKQIVYIDLQGYTILFYRDKNGSIDITRSSDEVDDFLDEHLSSPDSLERRTIIEELMTCLQEPIKKIRF